MPNSWWRAALRIAIALVLCTIAAAAVACNERDGRAQEPSGPPRSFLMGFSSLPRDLSAASYADTIDFAGDYGDLLLVQRTPPWAEFVPDGDVAEATSRATASERDAIEEQDVELFFAIDPTDAASGRDRLAGLPSSLTGKRFDDPDVRRAFVSYAEYVALNYKPEYMALGVEMNLYYEHNKDDFAQFETLYEEAYEAVKKQSPDTQVSLTFQYEDLYGILPRDDPHFEDWQLVTRFEDKSDFTAISTYPGFVFASAGAIPENYYSQLRAYTEDPIVIAEMGWSSAPAQQGASGGTESEQAAFLDRMIGEAEDLGMPLVVWYAIWDPAYTRDTAFGAFQSIGLRREDDTEKPAWSVWRDEVARPYEP